MSIGMSARAENSGSQKFRAKGAWEEKSSTTNRANGMSNVSDKKNKQIEQSFPGTVYYYMSVVGSCARDIGSKPLDVGSQYMSYTGKLSILVVNQRIKGYFCSQSTEFNQVKGYFYQIQNLKQFSHRINCSSTHRHPPHHGNTHPLHGGPC